MEELQKFFTVTDAAIEKGCTRDTIYKLIREGKINVVKAGKRRIIVGDENFRALKLQKDRITELEKRIELLENTVRQLQKKATGLDITKEPSQTKKPKRSNKSSN